MRDEFAFGHLTDWVFAGQYELRVVGYVIRFPANLNTEIFQGLIQKVDIQSSVVFALFIPIFSLVADSFELFDLLFVEGVAFEVVVLCFIQLGQILNAIVLQKVAQSCDVVHDADLFDLVYVLCVGETYQVWADCELFSI